LVPGWIEIIQKFIGSRSSNGSILKFPFIAQTRYNTLDSAATDHSLRKVLLLPSIIQDEHISPILTERISPNLWATLYPVSTLRDYSCFMTGLRNFEDVVFSQYLYERFKFEWHPEVAPIHSYTILQTASITGSPFCQNDIFNVSKAADVLYSNAVHDPESQLVAFLASYAIPVLLKKIFRTSSNHKFIALVSSIKCLSVLFRSYNIRLIPSLRFVFKLEGLALKRKLLYTFVWLCTPIAG
jgi:hypothetical protein